MGRMVTVSILLLVTLAACCSGAALNENIDIDISVDTDSKLYHQGKTVEGSFNYGYNVPRRNYNQYQHKVKGPDGVTYGCYGFVDPTNGTHLYHYVSDLKGYRVVPPNNPTRVYTERVANSVANIYDSVGEVYDWERLYFPDVCRVLQKSKEERNELSIPKGFQVNDDGSVTQTTQRPKPSPSTTVRTTPPAPRTTPASTPRATPPSAPRATAPPTTTSRPTTRRTTTTARANRPPATRPRPTQARTTPYRPAPTAAPATPRPSPRTERPTPQATPRATPRPTPKPFPNVPENSPKVNGNKFGANRDNFIGAPATNTAETLKPPQDLHAVGQEISELRSLLQMLLKSLNNHQNNNNSPKAGAAADCDDGLGAVSPNAKQVFLPLVLVDSLPGAPRGSPAPAGVPAGSQFAIPSVGYGAPRCNSCG